MSLVATLAVSFVICVGCDADPVPSGFSLDAASIRANKVEIAEVYGGQEGATGLASDYGSQPEALEAFAFNLFHNSNARTVELRAYRLYDSRVVWRSNALENYPRSSSVQWLRSECNGVRQELSHGTRSDCVARVAVFSDAQVLIFVADLNAQDDLIPEEDTGYPDQFEELLPPGRAPVLSLLLPLVWPSYNPISKPSLIEFIHAASSELARAGLDVGTATVQELATSMAHDVFATVPGQYLPLGGEVDQRNRKRATIVGVGVRDATLLYERQLSRELLAVEDAPGDATGPEATLDWSLQFLTLPHQMIVLRSATSCAWRSSDGLQPDRASCEQSGATTRVVFAVRQGLDQAAHARHKLRVPFAVAALMMLDPSKGHIEHVWALTCEDEEDVCARHGRNTDVQGHEPVRFSYATRFEFMGAGVKWLRPNDRSYAYLPALLKLWVHNVSDSIGSTPQSPVNGTGDSRRWGATAWDHRGPKKYSPEIQGRVLSGARFSGDARHAGADARRNRLLDQSSSSSSSKPTRESTLPSRRDRKLVTALQQCSFLHGLGSDAFPVCSQAVLAFRLPIDTIAINVSVGSAAATTRRSLSGQEGAQSAISLTMATLVPSTYRPLFYLIPSSLVRRDGGLLIRSNAQGGSFDDDLPGRPDYEAGEYSCLHFLIALDSNEILWEDASACMVTDGSNLGMGFFPLRTPTAAALLPVPADLVHRSIVTEGQGAQSEHPHPLEAEPDSSEPSSAPGELIEQGGVTAGHRWATVQLYVAIQFGEFLPTGNSTVHVLVRDLMTGYVIRNQKVGFVRSIIGPGDAVVVPILYRKAGPGLGLSAEQAAAIPRTVWYAASSSEGLHLGFWFHAMSSRMHGRLIYKSTVVWNLHIPGSSPAGAGAAPFSFQPLESPFPRADPQPSPGFLGLPTATPVPMAEQDADDDGGAKDGKPSRGRTAPGVIGALVAGSLAIAGAAVLAAVVYYWGGFGWSRNGRKTQMERGRAASGHGGGASAHRLQDGLVAVQLTEGARAALRSHYELSRGAGSGSGLHRRPSASSVRQEADSDTSSLLENSSSAEPVRMGSVHGDAIAVADESVDDGGHEVRLWPSAKSGSSSAALHRVLGRMTGGPSMPGVAV